MTRWTNLDEAEIASISAHNRASHVKVEDRRNGAQTAVKAATERSGQPQAIDLAKQRSAKRHAAKKPVPTEHQEQCAVIDWWAVFSASKGIDQRLLFAVPNAAKRSYQLAAMMKGAGMRPGVPDLMLAFPMRDDTGLGYIICPGLFLELKRTSGSKTSEEQTGYQDVLRKQGYRVVVCKGASEAITAITEYLS